LFLCVRHFTADKQKPLPRQRFFYAREKAELEQLFRYFE
jgi:hypothetical protein